MKTIPPKKQPGQATGRRKIDGAILDVRGTALFIGSTEKGVRSAVERGVLPFRRYGRRLVFLRAELEKYLESLPGCTLEQVMDNLAKRNGQHV